MLCMLVFLFSACRTSKSVQQSVALENHNSVHDEYHSAKTVDSLLSVQLYREEDITIIEETFTLITDTTGQVTGSVLSKRIRIASNSKKDSTAVFYKSVNVEEQQQTSAISDTHIDAESKEERKTSTRFPWQFFAFLFVLIVLFASKLKKWF
ncbi:hypothetical protein EZS27_031849 [termite gut metagenome]|uniref:Uncharacterized protein n=1 Tax=termite gut metagenome TaxID=433724 RepID=A0A5J4Q8X8_9ZZZZ